MKKIFVLAFVALSLFITACGKSDDSNETLPGTWYLVYQNDAGEEVKLTECDKTDHYVFTENTYTYYEALNTTSGCETQEFSGKLTVSGNQLSLDDVTFIFSISGNRLTLTVTEKDEDGTEETSVEIYEKR
ncbi:hypothetical protein RCZ04_02290 [Capnocytophaga sp. HP1101]